MIKILRFIFTGNWHSHDWEIIMQGSLVNTLGQTQGRYYHQKCKDCGKLKYTKFT